MDIRDVQDWAEYELADLKVKAKELVAAYFRDRKERFSNLKLWPRMREYAAGRTFYLTWSALEYSNPRNKVMRTKHLTKGTCKKKIRKACNGSEEAYEFVMSYYDRFEGISHRVSALGKIMASLTKLDYLEKEAKEALFTEQNQ